MPKKNNHIKSLPLSEVAYQKIKELIVTLKLGPMDQVDEEWLAKKLSIGRTPIREALFRLNAENLVEVVRGRGFLYEISPCTVSKICSKPCLSWNDRQWLWQLNEFDRIKLKISNG